MVFELIPFVACTSAAGAIGTGVWYVAMKESTSNKKILAPKLRSEDKDQFFFSAKDGNFPEMCGVGIDVKRLPSGEFSIQALNSSTLSPIFSVCILI